MVPELVNWGPVHQFLSRAVGLPSSCSQVEEAGVGAAEADFLAAFFGATSAFLAEEARASRSFFLAWPLRRFIFGELRRSFLPIG